MPSVDKSLSSDICKAKSIQGKFLMISTQEVDIFTPSHRKMCSSTERLIK